MPRVVQKAYKKIKLASYWTKESGSWFWRCLCQSGWNGKAMTYINGTSTTRCRDCSMNMPRMPVAVKIAHDNIIIRAKMQGTKLTPLESDESIGRRRLNAYFRYRRRLMARRRQ